MSESFSESVVIGTAGHIDHGKSSLVLALTGVDPDRLAEEKKRGITIELGFAKLDLPNGTSASIVDVPGHEKFVRQMISGASGIDAALLVIAADDGIMPQTKEHLAVLRLLEIPTCVVALTKCDMVDDEWADFVADEVSALMSETPYAGCPVIKTSSKTGLGLEDLKHALESAVSAGQRAHSHDGLRFPVDRCFVIKGAGTVVTGTLWSGTVRTGDEVKILPSGIKARVRSLQVHGQDADASGAGHRLAMNLNAVSTDQVRPGDFIVSPNAPDVSDRFDAAIVHLDPEKGAKPLESGVRVRIAHGTKEVLGRILLMDGLKSLQPGERAWAQIRLETPLSVERGERFVIRSYSPVHVVGGGQILLSHPRRRSILDENERSMLSAIESGNLEKAILSLVEAPEAFVKPSDAASLFDMDEGKVAALLDAMAKSKRIVKFGDDAELYATRGSLQKAAASLEKALLGFHAKNPTDLGMTKAALHHDALPKLDGRVFEAVLGHAEKAGGLIVSEGVVSHPKAGAGAKAKAEKTASEALSILKDALTTPPSVPEVQAKIGCTASEAYAAFGRLEKDGVAVKIDRDLYMETEAFESLAKAVRSELESCGEANAARLKDAMGISRKYAIPVLEKLDALGVTKRVGDVRTL